MSQRNRRFNETVKEIVAEHLVDLKDPRIGFVTVTEARVNTDRTQAEVFFTALPDDPESIARTLEGLESAKPLLRRELGARLRTRNVPDLHFRHDEVPAQGRRIDELLREARRADAPASGEHDDADR